MPLSRILQDSRGHVSLLSFLVIAWRTTWLSVISQSNINCHIIKTNGKFPLFKTTKFLRILHVYCGQAVTLCSSLLSVDPGWWRIHHNTGFQNCRVNEKNLRPDCDTCHFHLHLLSKASHMIVFNFNRLGMSNSLIRTITQYFDVHISGFLSYFNIELCHFRNMINILSFFPHIFYCSRENTPYFLLCHFLTKNKCTVLWNLTIDTFNFYHSYF